MLTFFPNPGLMRPLLLGSLEGSWVGDGDETGGEGDGDGDCCGAGELDVTFFFVPLGTGDTSSSTLSWDCLTNIP